MPFEIPSSWEWCRVGDLFSNMSGLAYKKDALAIKADKMIRVLRGGNIGEEQFLFKGDDVFISSELVKPELYLRKNYMITPAVSSLDHIGKIALIDKDYSDTVVGGFVLMLIPHFNDDVVSEYLLYAFAAKHHRDNCRNITHKSGQAFYNLSREQMMNLPVPIPPREEMGRIIAMLKRVLPKVADYAVVDTALQNLNGSFPEALKKSILQEAVQGKLVPQAPSDEPAEALLERIRAEKQRLIKEGKIKKDKHESVIFRRDNSHYEKRGSEEVCIDDEIPFEIPENWVWCRFEAATLYVTDYVANGSFASLRENVKTYKEENYALMVKTQDFSNDFTRGLTYTDQKGFDYLQKSRLYGGELMLSNIGASIGKAFIIPTMNIRMTLAPNAIVVKCLDTVMTEYLRYFILSYYGQKMLSDFTAGTAMPKFSKTQLRSALLPVPPYSEQKRIIEKIKQLDVLVCTL